MPNDFARCVIRHPDGRWLYNLPNVHSTTGVVADGQAMTRISERSSWWAADHEAERITLVHASRPKITGYLLRDADAMSVRFPAELTVEEWDDRSENSSDAEEEMLCRLYQAQTVPKDTTETHIDGPFIVLDGTEPPAPGGPLWTVNLRDSITQRPEYNHLFPGRLSGLRDHLRELIKNMRRVDYCFKDYEGKSGLHVTLKVPFETPETYFVPNTGARNQPLRSGHTRTRTVSRTIDLPVPDSVQGETHADALAEWNAQVDFWTGLVTEATVAACNHCRGTGHVPSGAEQYTAKR